MSDINSNFEIKSNKMFSVTEDQNLNLKYVK